MNHSTTITHASLFTGIGGFDLAAEKMGWKNLFHCEINTWEQQLLKYYWPNAISYGDITQTDFHVHRGGVHVLSGGFPCQDASLANMCGGGQQGLQGERTGLWHHTIRAIAESRPLFFVGENVANILKTNQGDDFRIILEGLARLGYNAEWRVCRGSEVGSCHKRARLYLVAHSCCIRLQEAKSFYAHVFPQDAQERRFIAGTTAQVGISWEDEPEVHFVDDGISKRLDRITFSKWATETIKAAGNAVVHEIPRRIFQSIDQIIKSNMIG